ERVGVELSERLPDAVAARAAGQIVRIEVGLREDREESAGANVDGDDRAGGMHAHRPLDRLLQLHVDREPEIAPRERLLPRRRVEETVGLGPAPVTATRVDDPLLPAAPAAQVALPRALD